MRKRGHDRRSRGMLRVDACPGPPQIDLDSFLTGPYVIVTAAWQATHPASRRPGRPVRLSAGEALTLALVAPWPRWRSERACWR
jgi:hypothetical protein